MSAAEPPRGGGSGRECGQRPHHTVKQCRGGRLAAHQKRPCKTDWKVGGGSPAGPRDVESRRPEPLELPWLDALLGV